MKMTKIERRDLNRGDMYAVDNSMRVYLASVDGVTYPINLANETIYRIDVANDAPDSVAQDVATIKSVAMLAGQTSVIIGEECAKRGKRIKELQYINQTLSDQLETLRMKVFDIEGREDLVTTDLEHRIELRDAEIDKLEQINVQWLHKAEGLENENSGLIKMVAKNDKTSLVNLEECQRSNRSLQNTNDVLSVQLEEVLSSTTNEQVENLECANIDLYNETKSLHRDIGVQDKRIKELEEMLCDVSNPCAIAVDESIKHDLKLLDTLLAEINPYAAHGYIDKSDAELAEAMREMCMIRVDWARSHNIVGRAIV